MMEVKSDGGAMCEFKDGPSLRGGGQVSVDGF